ncbi:hypothetical protein ND748_01105 [Frankia sp. AiPs1]|uniref:hypothetical protein n=1 Tax=Frankia sp. AiPs1 TaxID=573493 RepID=UPI002043232B|nr:hypothetical protein [Frankia sp. AiPs1]MCM3920287.1 hypothetical protein [Frankia sp. AiPs1]
MIVAVTALPAAADDVEVHPSWEGMPEVDKIQRILNVTAQGSLVSSMLAVLIGAGVLGLGRAFGSMGSGSRAASYIFGGGGGALLVAVCAKMVAWLVAPSASQPA